MTDELAEALLALFERLAPHVDGIIVGSALVEAIERGEDAGAFLQELCPRRAA